MQRSNLGLVVAVASHTSATDWIVGGIFLPLVVTLVWAIVRKVNRARRRGRSVTLTAEGVTMGSQSRLVLPAEPRTRPIVDPKPVPMESVSAHSKASRLMHRRVPIPAWLLVPLAWLGLLYVILTPIGRDWYMYGLGLLFAVGIGVRVRRRHRATVLYRSGRASLYWVRWLKKGEPDPEPPRLAL